MSKIDLYEKIEFEHYWEAVKLFETGVKIYYILGVTITEIVSVYRLCELYNTHAALYIKTDWRAVALKFVDNCYLLNDNSTLLDMLTEGETDNGRSFDAEFIGLCHIIAGMTERPE